MGWPKSSFGFFHKMLGKGCPLQYSGLENSMDCSPWGRRESDTTESLSLSHKKFWPTQYLQFLYIYLFLTFHGIIQCMAFGSDFFPLAQRFQGLSLQHVSVLYSFLLLTSSPLCQDRGFPGGTSGKEPACQCRRLRDTGSIPGFERSPGGGHGTPLQCSCLENPMDRGAWRAAVYRVTQSRTRLKQFSTHTCMYEYTTFYLSTHLVNSCIHKNLK